MLHKATEGSTRVYRVQGIGFRASVSGLGFSLQNECLKWGLQVRGLRFDVGF